MNQELIQRVIDAHMPAEIGRDTGFDTVYAAGFNDAVRLCIDQARAAVRDAIESKEQDKPIPAAWVPQSFFRTGSVAATARRSPPSASAKALRGDYVPLYLAPFPCVAPVAERWVQFQFLEMGRLYRSRNGQRIRITRRTGIWDRPFGSDFSVFTLEGRVYGRDDSCLDLMEVLDESIPGRGAVPDGYVLVPINPTEEMLRAGSFGLDRVEVEGGLTNRAVIAGKWAAMLAASTEQP